MSIPVQPLIKARGAARPPRPESRENPSHFDAMLVNPLLEVEPDSITAQVRDMRRPIRRRLGPMVRFFVLRCVDLILIVKGLLPFQFSSERALNFLGPWFLRRCASPEAREFILRHFTVETNLINFVARNSGGGDVAEVDLRPTAPDQVGDVDGLNAILRHDANIYNLFIDLGHSTSANVHEARPLASLDFDCLDLPELLPAADRPFVELNLETCLYLIVLCLALFLDEETIERAVNSFQLDESLLAAIANLTGDDAFRSWTPVKYANWLGRTRDPGRDLYWHMIVQEYAHTRLRRLGRSATNARPAGNAQ